MLDFELKSITNGFNVLKGQQFAVTTLFASTLIYFMNV